MPTITQLPSAAQVTAADRVPLSQSGITQSVSVGTLLATCQPAILTDSGTLLGRTSLGAGGPEPVHLGTGLVLSGTTLAATGQDHADFPEQATLRISDYLVVNSDAQPRLMQIGLLRDLFSAGANVSISPTGTISASASGQSADVATLPALPAAASTDLLPISRSGVDYAIGYGALLDGQTIDMARPAAAAQDGDEFWIAQGTNTMLRQNLSAIWLWILSKLPGVKREVVELTSDTTLDATVHNNRVLVCSQPISLQAASINMGSGFECDVINVSSGGISLSGGFITSSGQCIIPPGQVAAVRCVAYSGGVLTYAGLSAVGGTTSLPGPVSSVTVSKAGTTSIDLLWVPAANAATYVVQYRVQGAPNWLLAYSGLAATSCSIANLLPSTAYEFGILAVNSAGSSNTPATATATTAAPMTPPGQVVGLAAGSLTTNSVSLSWSAPTTGGPVGTYTVQYRIAGTSGWTTASSGLTANLCTVSALVPNTSYEFQVFAINNSGAGPASVTVGAATETATGAVTSISWNVVPSGNFTRGVGSIGVNAHVNPGTASVQFGFSTSSAALPTSWVAGTYVNTDLWGAYITTPATAGTWYAWVAGTDGSCPTAYPNGFTVS